MAALPAAFAVPRLKRAGPSQGRDDRFEEIAGLVTSKMAEYHVPGAGLGILHEDQANLRAFGITSLDHPQPVTNDTLFTIASITKTVTATAVMKLVEEGRVDVRAPIRTYLPDFRVQDEDVSRRVSLWHLLTHTPGWEGQLVTEDRGAHALSHFASTIMPTLPQLAPPGVVWSYNNAGFTLAGRLIEVVTGLGIHDALRQLVFGPLGLARTVTRLTEAMTYPMTLGHRDRDGRTEVIRPFEPTSSPTAGGVLISLGDLMQYARFHLGSGAGADGRPYLSRAGLESMQAPQLRKAGTGDEMGLGWHVRRLAGAVTLAHGGTLNGHCLLLQLVPSRNLAFTILTNHAQGWRLVQDVEQAILTRYASLALAPGQPVGHRGVNEAMSLHSRPLEAQPRVDDYLGIYRRPPVGVVDVRLDGARLVVAASGQPEAPVVFYGPDVAYATAGPYVGMPVEFVRAEDGGVRWIRVNGRIARKGP
jgi:CubicO group peptidase (beta-lactamase class C family)